MQCSFCLCDAEDRVYIQGAEETTHICSECIKAAYEFVVVRGIETAEDLDSFNETIGDGKEEPTMELNADKITYIVPAKIVDDFGVNIQGVGLNPILVIEDSATGKAIGLYGDPEIKNANKIETEDGGIAEIVYQYFQNVGLQDFNNACNQSLEGDYLVQLVQGAIDQDVGDFQEESGMDCIIIEPDSFRDEDFLGESLDCVGIWVSRMESAEIAFDGASGVININGDNYTDWHQIAGEKLIDADENTMACIK